MAKKEFFDVGEQKGLIDVHISYRIIQLFSDNMYSSPNKALEELVANSWDAGAKTALVFLPADRDAPDAQIVVVDDGVGMDENGLRQHWVLGESKKREDGALNHKGRKPIGKFGIGKLATYVLAKRLSHVSKVNGRYWSTSMNYEHIDQGATDAKKEGIVALPLRELTESEAKEVVGQLLGDLKAVNKAIELFGKDASPTWTIAVMSKLKDMAKELREGRLRWVLETAMPLGDDFLLYLNGKQITSSHLKATKVGTWVLGKDVGTEKDPLPGPAPKEFEESEDTSQPDDSPTRFGVFHPALQRVTGFVEAYEDELGGKSENWGQSNGFFVYVRGRRVNVDDPGFGIDRNLLQHGTFSRFRMVVHMDGLDEELRSSRESVREGEKLRIAREVLRSGFNLARSKLAAHAEANKPGAAMSSRVAGSPLNLTARPVHGLLSETLSGNYQPRYFSVPKGLNKEQKRQLLHGFESPDEDGFRLVQSAELTPLSPQAGIAQFDVSTRMLLINTMHPFVAHFLNEFQNSVRSLPLELFAVSEVLLEAHLYQVLNNEEHVQDVLSRRDELLRHLAKTTGTKNAFLIAQDLEEAKYDVTALEQELVNACSSLGFESIPIGGPGKPDGIAEAHLPANAAGQQKYKVSLESKSKESADTKVSARTVNPGAVARHRDDYECDHALVIGPDFPSSNDGKTALEKEIAEAKGQPDKTITLMRVDDLARLVRVQPQKRIGTDKLRELFQTCRMPEQSAAWVTSIEAMEVDEPPYQLILEVIRNVQANEPESQVEYGKLKTALMYEKKLRFRDDELKELCKAMMRLAGAGYLHASDTIVALNNKPERVLEAIRSAGGLKQEAKK
jgi:hypothetical protein